MRMQMSPYLNDVGMIGCRQPGNNFFKCQWINFL
jgi:hypothetical protein